MPNQGKHPANFATTVPPQNWPGVAGVRQTSDMTNKRYGYKGPGGREGGAHDNYTLLRFAIVMAAFLMLMASWVYSGFIFFGIYFLSGLAYLVATFPAEILPRVKNGIVLLVSALIVLTSVYYNEEIFTKSVYVYEQAEGRDVRQVVYLKEAYYLFIIYNAGIAALSFPLRLKQRYV